MDDLLDEFLAETNENLDALTNDLVAWEQRPSDRSLLDGIFRFFHTIKGNSGFLDFERLGRLSHAAETALARAREGGVVPDSAFVSTIFAAIDRIRAILDDLAAAKAEPAGDDGDLIDRLEAAACKTADQPAAGETPRAESGTDDGANNGRRNQAASVRVSIALLDRLMGLASELVLARNALVRTTRNGEQIPGNLIEHVSACVTDLQDGINRTRMQPIEALWTPLPRMLRDLSNELRKELRLELEGGDTEIDRQLLEAMRDPITHMVRNAADHGVEPPDVRRKLGKVAAGTIRLSARQSGGHIFIELSDDGRGIDPDRLRARAVMMGLMSAADADALAETSAQALIFEPGLSTAASVTAISGRGVGMDVVRANLERIGGSVEVRSRVGHGSRFIIKVPLTLTIVPALIVGVGNASYAIAQSSIREIVRLKGGHDLSVVGGRQMILLRDTLIPVVDMPALFGMPATDRERWGVIVEINATARAVLLVDSVSDQEEIVIKPLSPLIDTAGVYSGATVLGNGEAALVLDLPGIAARTGIEAGAGIEEAKAEEATGPTASWILFETGGSALKAVPLGLVARIETFDRNALSHAGGRWMMCHEGRLIPLRTFGDIEPESVKGGLILVLDDGRSRVAVLVLRVADMVSEDLRIEQPAAVAGVAGIARIGAQTVEVVDTGWLMRNRREEDDTASRGSILIIGNRQFAVSMLKPLLESVGHFARIVGNAEEAAALIDGGMVFDLVLAEDESSAPSGLGGQVLRFGAGGEGEGRADAVDPYDRRAFLERVSQSMKNVSAGAA